MFIGVAAFGGAYNGYFTATPWLFETQAIQVAAAMLFSAAAGFLVCILVEIRVSRGGVSKTDPMAPLTPQNDPQPGLAAPVPVGAAPNSEGLNVLQPNLSKEN